MEKIKTLIKNNKLLIAILLLGLFLRIYRPAQLFLYTHDNDLSGWIVKDIVVNKHLRLIGQETSTQGIFIGAFFYYALIPFYLLFGMDPIGGVALITTLGLLSIISVYYVFLKVFDRKTALVATFLYATSFYMVFNDREVVPTMPVIAWTVWLFYCLDLILKGHQKRAFIILGILIGLIWHLNFALTLLLPLVLAALVLSKKKLNMKALYFGLTSLFVSSLPLILFELRHNFSQSKAFYFSLTAHQGAIVGGFDKFRRVILLLSKNLAGFVWGTLPGVKYQVTLCIFIVAFIYLVYKKLFSKNHAILLTFWLLIYIIFFSLYTKNLSEYYLNGTMLVFLIIASVFLSNLLKTKKLYQWGLLALIGFLTINLYRFISLDVNKSGYLERKAAVAEIKKDAQRLRLPCVAVSYITKPGYDLGYRYFFWLEGMHVNRPESRSPVYTIVFPLRKDIEVDMTFGAIGLIYPDYEIYTREVIEESCRGENSNLTDSMFGYTE